MLKKKLAIRNCCPERQNYYNCRVLIEVLINSNYFGLESKIYGFHILFSGLCSLLLVKNRHSNCCHFNTMPVSFSFSPTNWAFFTRPQQSRAPCVARQLSVKGWSSLLSKWTNINRLKATIFFRLIICDFLWWFNKPPFFNWLLFWSSRLSLSRRRRANTWSFQYLHLLPSSSSSTELSKCHFFLFCT